MGGIVLAMKFFSGVRENPQDKNPLTEEMDSPRDLYPSISNFRVLLFCGFTLFFGLVVREFLVDMDVKFSLTTFEANINLNNEITSKRIMFGLGLDFVFLLFCPLSPSLICNALTQGKHAWTFITRWGPVISILVLLGIFFDGLENYGIFLELTGGVDKNSFTDDIRRSFRKIYNVDYRGLVHSCRSMLINRKKHFSNN